jgi:DNA-binding NarL/FixJ family response regulator
LTAAYDPVRVLVVDDCAEARAAIGDVVLHADGFELVGSAASGEEALAALPRLDPGLVLLDVRMNGIDGVETSRLIRRSGSSAVVVLVSLLGRSELPLGAGSCGAAAILHKSEVSPRRLSALWQSLNAGAAATGRPPT